MSSPARHPTPPSGSPPFAIPAAPPAQTPTPTSATADSAASHQPQPSASSLPLILLLMRTDPRLKQPSTLRRLTSYMLRHILKDSLLLHLSLRLHPHRQRDLLHHRLKHGLACRLFQSSHSIRARRQQRRLPQ